MSAERIGDARAYRRAGGRRAYNARRRILAEIRRHDLVRYALDHGVDLLARGAAPRVARVLNVSRGTAWSDIRRILEGTASRFRCPTCQRQL